MSKQPFDEQGKFVPLECPRKNCGGGKLTPEGGGDWRCDGLAAPELDDSPLVACDFTHQDGAPYEPS
jgi:hypothetical protein